jgi:hypothetical protein
MLSGELTAVNQGTMWITAGPVENGEGDQDREVWQQTIRMKLMGSIRMKSLRSPRLCEAAMSMTFAAENGVRDDSDMRERPRERQNPHP